jgi:hypothetical protein
MAGGDVRFVTLALYFLCDLCGCHPEQCHAELVEALSKHCRRITAKGAKFFAKSAKN